MADEPRKLLAVTYCANPDCDEPILAHPWTEFCSLACLIEVRWTDQE
jgi:hypothetical protein